MGTLITTILNRPYVFLFLTAFLLLAIRHIGLGRSLIWLLIGYAIAFASEASSIRNGWPYGEYHYIYGNLKGELLLAGVPVWDSASYAFMTYAGYSSARWALPRARLWKIWLAGGLLTMLLDVITDPVARLGRQWFLGEIYYYADAGWYFGVPWTNFAGWLLVAMAIIGVNLLITRGEQKRGPDFLYPAFYISICLFNTTIAFSIGSYLLGLANLLITALIALFSIYQRRRSLP